MRIDKYLWCIRIFKSRTLATEACEGGKVKIDGRSVKPSHHINPGDIFTVQQGYIKRAFRIKALLEKRLAAKLITDFAEDITPAEEKEKLELARFASYHSKFKGMGRPTKKDRRALTQLRIKN
ncbi:MAG TPA: RNA-binding S4 domain-containing protein [Ignavibacteria bacterium]|nr:RNA-binding S4 domain-containing protein [Ignavibacteria bacterium]